MYVRSVTLHERKIALKITNSDIGVGRKLFVINPTFETLAAVCNIYLYTSRGKKNKTSLNFFPDAMHIAICRMNQVFPIPSVPAINETPFSTSIFSIIGFGVSV